MILTRTQTGKRFFLNLLRVETIDPSPDHDGCVITMASGRVHEVTEHSVVETFRSMRV